METALNFMKENLWREAFVEASTASDLMEYSGALS